MLKLGTIVRCVLLAVWTGCLTNAALAQTDLEPGLVEYSWDVNCTQAKIFENKTQIDVCGLRFAVFGLPEGASISPPRFIRVTGTRGTERVIIWHVDDNQDRDLAADETDNIDLTPNAAGTFAFTQAASAQNNDLSDCIPPDAAFTLQICGDTNPMASGAMNFLGDRVSIWPSNVDRVDLVACCVPGECLTPTEEGLCEAAGGTPSNGFCPGCEPPGEIPTVSGWGLFAMTLLVLTAGTVILLRRRPAKM